MVGGWGQGSGVGVGGWGQWFWQDIKSFTLSRRREVPAERPSTAQGGGGGGGSSAVSYLDECV